MTKKTELTNTIIFWLELILAVLVPFIICWSVTSTNVLNSNFPLKLLELIGVIGSVIMLFAGIPVGIIGILTTKRMKKMRTATIVLSILNLSIGIIEIAILTLIFCAVIFKGISV